MAENVSPAPTEELYPKSVRDQLTSLENGEYPEHIPPETPILGFTGALGTGCSTLAKGLAEYHNYSFFALSTPIHKVSKHRKHKETYEILQGIGNDLRRQRGLDILAWLALLEADKAWSRVSRSNSRYTGIVLDGIRNAREVESLRAFTNFFLFSIQASEDDQKKRLLSSNRCRTEDECKKAIERDADEKLEYGQQINRCNELADIVVLNDRNVQVASERILGAYVREKVYDPYVGLIELLSLPKRSKIIDFIPTVDETLMTAAYAESKRSRCLKRKVGAIITTKDGDIIASGYNDVPEGSSSCWEHPDYKWCYRDIIQEAAGRKILYCPKCGRKVDLQVKCVNCGMSMTAFAKRCPTCNSDPEISYECPGCESLVFKEFLIGTQPEAGKLLDVCRSLHAEENAIVKLSKMGIPVPIGARIFVTAFPCNLCANKIATSDISEVVYSEPYVTKEARDILTNNNVKVTPFQGVKSPAYFRLYR